MHLGKQAVLGSRDIIAWRNREPLPFAISFEEWGRRGQREEEKTRKQKTKILEWGQKHEQRHRGRKQHGPVTKLFSISGGQASDKYRDKGSRWERPGRAQGCFLHPVKEHGLEARVRSKGMCTSDLYIRKIPVDSEWSGVSRWERAAKWKAEGT